MNERKKGRKAHACDNASSCLLKQWLAIQCYNFYIITFLEHACIFLFFVSACLLKSYKYNIHLWQVDSFFFYCHEKKKAQEKRFRVHMENVKNASDLFSLGIYTVRNLRDC